MHPICILVHTHMYVLAKTVSFSYVYGWLFVCRYIRIFICNVIKTICTTDQKPYAHRCKTELELCRTSRPDTAPLPELPTPKRPLALLLQLGPHLCQLLCKLRHLAL